MPCLCAPLLPIVRRARRLVRMSERCAATLIAYRPSDFLEWRGGLFTARSPEIYSRLREVATHLLKFSSDCQYARRFKALTERFCRGLAALEPLSLTAKELYFRDDSAFRVMPLASMRPLIGLIYAHGRPGFYEVTST